jgi:putative SOS response-associated peptidase YedK
MCGRYARFTSAEVYARLFDAEGNPDLEPRYNVSPSQRVLAARQRPDGRRELVGLTWGLLPAWAREPRLAYSTINARAETVAEKPAFRQALRRRRCLIAADGFYEWRRLDGRKQPYFIRLRGGEPFALAGLWEHWASADTVIQSCTIVVTRANELVARVHDRMPVLLDPADYARWTDPGTQDPAEVLALLRPYPPERMEAYPVGTEVNSPRNDGPSLIERLATDAESPRAGAD